MDNLLCIIAALLQSQHLLLQSYSLPVLCVPQIIWEDMNTLS